MPDDWLSIVRSFSQDFYHDSSRFRLAVGTSIPERQPVYAVCQLCSSGKSLATQRLFTRGSPGLCLRQRIINALILLGPIMCREAPYPGHVVIFLSCLGLLTFFFKVYRPPTPPKRSVRRPNSCAVPSMLEAQSSLGSPYRMVRYAPTWTASWLKTSVFSRSFQILHLFTWIPHTEHNTTLHPPPSLFLKTPISKHPSEPELACNPWCPPRATRQFHLMQTRVLGTFTAIRRRVLTSRMRRKCPNCQCITYPPQG
jgi:hypothetical protein